MSTTIRCEGKLDYAGKPARTFQATAGTALDMCVRMYGQEVAIEMLANGQCTVVVHRRDQKPQTITLPADAGIGKPDANQLVQYALFKKGAHTTGVHAWTMPWEPTGKKSSKGKKAVPVVEPDVASVPPAKPMKGGRKAHKDQSASEELLALAGKLASAKPVAEPVVPDVLAGIDPEQAGQLIQMSLDSGISVRELKALPVATLAKLLAEQKS